MLFFMAEIRITKVPTRRTESRHQRSVTDGLPRDFCWYFGNQFRKDHSILELIPTKLYICNAKTRGYDRAIVDFPNLFVVI